MKHGIRVLVLTVLLLLWAYTISAVYLTDVPTVVIQPDKTELSCLASGDEFHNWLHDKDGYTIIQSPKTGYYVYAEKSGDELVAGTLIAGRDNPQTRGLVPGLNISRAAYRQKFNAFHQEPQNTRTQITGTVNNVIIYIRFSDQPEYTRTVAGELDRFNSTDPDMPSMKNYFTEASYGIVTVNSTLLPTQTGTTILSYQDIYPRSYYCPYNAVTNENGYTSNIGARQSALFTRAVNYVSSMLPAGINLDVNNDNFVDNVVFFIQGPTTAWADFLWPHMSSIGSLGLTLGTKTIGIYNLAMEGMSAVSVFCHEMTHTFGAPDYYHYSEDGLEPVGSWDIMASNAWNPQHPSAFTKWKYLGWISEIPNVAFDQVNTLNPLTSPTGNAFKILSPNTSDEYFVVEYRRKTGLFENNLYDSGLLVWRVDTTCGNGNAGGPPDELYVYRYNGTATSNGILYQATFSADEGRTVFNDSTNPPCVLQSGNPGGVSLQNVGVAGETISFYCGPFYYNFINNPITDNFDTGSFPTTGAANVPITGTSVFTKVDAGVNPTCTPVSRNSMITYNSRGNASGNSAYYSFPKLVVEQANVARYSVSFMMHRDAEYSTSTDRIEVYRNTVNSLSGSPVLLGTVHRSLALAPGGSVNGWNQFAFQFSPVTNGNYYIILKAISGNGNNIFIDNVKFERHCQALVSNPSPVNNAVDVSSNPVFTWQTAGLPPTGLRISLGTDNPPTSVLKNVLLANVTSYTLPRTLGSNMQYYWQVVPYDDYGNGFSPQVYSFTTTTLSPVTSLPYLENFEYDGLFYPPGWSTLNVNNDSNEWRITSMYQPPSGTKVFSVSNGNFSNSIDDWAITRGMNLTAGSNYQASFSFKRTTQTGTIKIAVYVSDSANHNDPKTLIYLNENITNSSVYAKAEMSFTSTFTGTHYILIRAYVTSGSSIGIIIDDFKLMGAISATVTNPNPANNQLSVAINSSLGWQLGSGTPTGYYLSLGTDNPPTNIANRLEIGNVTSWTPPAPLSNGTLYYWQVTPFNSTGEALNPPIWSFRTTADASIVLPYTENFDALTIPQVPQGWTVLNLDGDGNKWQSSTVNSSSTPNCVRTRRNASQTANDWLITAPVRLFAGSEYQLKFKFRNEEFTGIMFEKLLVAIGFAAHQDFLTTVIYDNPTIGNNNYQTATVNFTPAVDGIYYIGFKNYGDSYYFDKYLYLDNIELTSLGVPSAVYDANPSDTQTNVMINETTLSWEHSGDVTGYRLNLGTDNPPTNILQNYALGLLQNYEQSGLWNFNTQYFWQVIPFNSVGDCTTAPVFSFTTMAANPIATFPYFEDCESATVPILPGGYFSQDIDQDGITWKTYGTTAKSLRIDSSLSQDSDDWLFLPGLSIIAGSSYSLDFSYRQGVEGKTGELEVFIGATPTPASMLQNLFTNEQIEYSAGFNTANISFVPETAGTYYVGIHYSSLPDQGYILVDDISIDRTPAPVLSGLPTDNALGVKFYPSFSWGPVSGNPDGYLFYLGTDNPPTNLINGLDLVTITEYQVLEMLQPDTQHFWQVKPYNNQGSSSACPVFSFTTMRDITVAQLPYSEGFEAQGAPNIPMHWQKQDVNADGVTWLGSTIYPRSGLNCVTIEASSQVMNDWLILPPIYLEQGLQYRLAFYAKKSNQQSNETLKIYYGNAPNPASMTNLIRTTSVAFTSYNLNLVNFTPTSPGAYYIGFKGCSLANQGSIYLDDISLGLISNPYNSPQNLTAIPSYTSIELNWQAPQGNTQTSYKLFRNGLMIAAIPANQTFFNDITAVTGEDYVYFLKAVYSSPSGESATSNHVYSALYIVGVVQDYPATAHTPLPANNAIDIPVNTSLSWTYTSHPAFSDPIGFRVKIGTNPSLAGATESYVTGGVGNHSINVFTSLAFNTTYYWQVIPTTNSRGDALNCQVWSFTTQESSGVISIFPYTEYFYAGPEGWTTGGASAGDLWQLGEPNQTKINSAYFGDNAWMTNLTQNYPDNANAWLMSPAMDFSEVVLPKLSVWLNIWCEAGYDGMILESSIDSGASWQKVVGDINFYNNTSASGPLAPPKWSGSTEGVNGIWTQYSSTLPGLGNQELVYLRFRFMSDFSIAMEGIAVDLIRIWDADGPTFGLNPTSYDFDEYNTGTTSDWQEFVISNLTIETVELSPADITIEGSDAIDFNLTNLEETTSFGPMDMASVYVRFAPLSIGAKEASLQITDSRSGNQSTTLSLTRQNQSRSREVLQASLTGIGILPSFYWAQDFALVTPGQIPAEWTATDAHWSTTNSNFAGGASPEMRFNWNPRYTGDLYLNTAPINTSGFENLTLSFKHSLDDYSGSYTLKALSIVGTTQYLIHEWVNPTGDIPAQTVEFELNAIDHGIGASNLQIAWVFSGDTYRIDNWYIDNVIISTEAPPPAAAHSPIPANNAINISVGTHLGWTYSSQPAYTDPVGFIIKAGTNPTLAGSTDTYIAGGIGSYNIAAHIDFDYGTTYFWQVIPTTDASPGGRADSREERTNASNCPIWSFTTASLSLVIDSTTYIETFDAGYSGWTSGFITGSNLWELGTPAQANINSAHSGTKAWMTLLTQNYTNDANTWLKSPKLDFSSASNPKLSVWINQWCEANYDGMILESTIDDGLSWQYVSGDGGFYNNFIPSGPIAAPKWSGLSGNWVKYSTLLPGLENQDSAYLRFRFASDNSTTLEGIALDDISIWSSIEPVFSIYPTAHDFGMVALGGSNLRQDFYISNQGAGVISLAPEDILITGTNASEFYLINLTEAVNIESFESVMISVEFSPDSLGQKSASLQISDNLARAMQIQLSRDDNTLRSSTGRSLHQVSLSGEVYEPIVKLLPWEEDFTGIEFGLLPAGWETTNQNWSVQDMSQSGGEAPEMVFASNPVANTDFYLISPYINSSGMDELLLSFKQRVNHYDGDYSLKVMAMVGSTEYLIGEWVNPNNGFPAQGLEFTLSALNHGVGAANLRIAWVFSGNSNNINQWQIDDILLEEKVTTPIPPNPPQNLKINCSNNAISLSWDAVNLATGYKIYSSSIPSELPEDWRLEASVTGLSWSASTIENLRFYRVVAIKASPARVQQE